MIYSKLLENPLWKKKSAEIKLRDGRCQICGETKNLHVHHKLYIKDRLPWDYEDDYLITLCAGCHKEEHRDDKHIKDIIHSAKLLMTNKELKEALRPLYIIYNCKECGCELDEAHVRAFGMRCLLC